MDAITSSYHGNVKEKVNKVLKIFVRETTKIILNTFETKFKHIVSNNLYVDNVGIKPYGPTIAGA